MMDKKYDNVEFEVSMGSYGNKFESMSMLSLTESENSVYDGRHILQLSNNKTSNFAKLFICLFRFLFNPKDHQKRQDVRHPFSGK